MPMQRKLQIHFTMNRKLYLRKGFTYIEVMIASTIFTILVVPLTQSFYQAMKNHEVALLYYMGYLNAQNIADDLAEELSDGLAMENLENYFSSKICQYDLENYTYHIYLMKEKSEKSEILYFQAGESMKEIPLEGIAYEESFPVESSNLEIIINDAEGTIVENENITYMDKKLYFSEFVNEDYYIDLEIKEPQEKISIYNYSENQIFISLFSGEVELQTKNIIINHALPPKQNYFLLVDTYSNDIFIKRFVRLI